MNALVISGGGSKGAYGGGIAEYLINDREKDYDLYLGTSSGALLVPLLALKEVDRIKSVFSNITNKDVYSICPFKVHTEKEVKNYSVNNFGIIRQYLKKEKTFGNSENLRRLIRNTWTEKDYYRLKELNKELIITVSNLTKLTTEYKSSNDYSYDLFVDWIWASANMVPMMSLFKYEGQEYADGGMGSLIPIQEAINKGATNIDVIVLRQEHRKNKKPPLKNPFQALMRSFEFMLSQIGKDDITIGSLEARNKNVNIHFYYIPKELTDYSYSFHKHEMKNWWEEGYQCYQIAAPNSISLNPEDT